MRRHLLEQCLVLSHAKLNATSFPLGKVAQCFLIRGLNQYRRKIRADSALDVEAITAQNRDQVQPAATTKFQHPNSILSELLRQTFNRFEIDRLVVVIEKITNPKAGGSRGIFQDRVRRRVLAQEMVSFL